MTQPKILAPGKKLTKKEAAELIAFAENEIREYEAFIKEVKKRV